ncbi:MAG: hypothetical protein JWM42_3197 [Burkholderia sp.]|nr:hypothetical protein [Burkholderia sp.]
MLNCVDNNVNRLKPYTNFYRFSYSCLKYARCSRDLDVEKEWATAIYRRMQYRGTKGQMNARQARAMKSIVNASNELGLDDDELDGHSGPAKIMMRDATRSVRESATSVSPVPLAVVDANVFFGPERRNVFMHLHLHLHELRINGSAM